MTKIASSGRGDSIEAFHRYWSMLSKIPREPRQIDAGRLESLLEMEGIEISRRTIQRDLDKLSTLFPGLLKDARSKPYGWKWSKHAPTFLVPKMNLEAAVTLELVAQHLSTMLPRSSVKALRSVFDQAHEVLASGESRPLAQWPKKVRSLPQGHRRRIPELKASILDSVYEGLLHERVLTLSYQKYEAASAKEYQVHPLGLVERSGVLNLVCTFNDYGEPMHIVLHRVSAVSVGDSKRKRPRAFDLDEYIAAGNLGYLVGPEIKVRARISDEFARSLVESPLGADQRLSPDKEGYEKLTVTLNDSMELRGWIRSMGPMFEVLGPKKLRDAMRAEAQALAKMYR